MRTFMITVMVLFLAITGCATLKEAAKYSVQAYDIGKNIKYIDNNIEVVTDYIYTGDFYTIAEQQEIQSIVVDVDGIIKRVEIIINKDDKKEILMSIQEVNAIMIDARTVYARVYALVSRNWDKYSDDQKKHLQMMREALIKIDSAWLAITTNDEGKDITPVIVGVIEVASGLISTLNPK